MCPSAWVTNKLPWVHIIYTNWYYIYTIYIYIYIYVLYIDINR